MSKPLQAFVFFLFSTIFLLSCQNTDKELFNEVFRYNQESGISSLDPAYARDQATIWATSQIFNGLIELDSNLMVQPSIAHSWEVSADLKTYTFFLRDDVSFHKHHLFGLDSTRKVVAADFVYSFERIINPLTASPGAWIFNGKVGENPFRAINDSTLEITLLAPFPPFLGMLSMPYCYVVPKELVTYYGKDFRKQPIGTGPFKFFMWEEAEQLILHKNENYWEFEENKRLPYLKAVTVSFKPDKQTAFLEMLQGNIDYISGIDPSFKDAILDNAGKLKPKYADQIALQKAPYLNTEFIAFNLESETPFQNKLVRQAFNHAFDRALMLKFLRNNVGNPNTYGIIPLGLPGHFESEKPRYEYNPKKVAELLKEAGFDNQRIKINLQTTPTYLDIATYIQSQVAKHGFDISIETMPGPTLRQQITKGTSSFFRGSWIADYPDAENYLILFESSNIPPIGPNNTRTKNKEIDALYQKALSTANDSMRYLYYAKADSIIAEEAAVVVLYYDEALRLLNPKIKGFRSNGLNQLDLRRVIK